MKTFLLLVTTLSVVTNTLAIKCYSCSQSGTDTDRKCLENPAAVTAGSPTVNCGKKYCTIFRQEYKDPKGQIATFLRGCEDVPTYLNKDIVDENYKTFYRACTKNLCNNGTGTESIIGNGFGGDIGPAGVIIIKGKGTSNGYIHKIKLSTIVLVLLIYLFI